MWLLTACSLSAYVAGAAAFKNTSPFLIFSTSELLFPSPTQQLQSASDVLRSTKDVFRDCPSETYVIVSQPYISAADLSSSGAAPYLRQAMSSQSTKTEVSISDVVDQLSAEELQQYLALQCNVDIITVDATTVSRNDFKPSKQAVIRLDLPAISNVASKRASDIAHNDSILKDLLDAIPTQKYTVMYTTTPAFSVLDHEVSLYEPEFQEPLNVELKRRSDYQSGADQGTVRDNAPLFEKYQFFTPGIFMGLLVSLLLLSILSVGIRAVSSLQVSYSAFEKEMGPSAQKKVQ